MKITWYGHAAFGIEGRNPDGDPLKVVLDPYNYPGCGGYLPIDEEADIVSISHDNPTYHSDTSAIRGDFELVEGLAFAGESHEARGVTFEAMEVHENTAGEGPNAMVRFELDEVVVAHQGDLGHPLGADGIEFLRPADVLLALAGGPPTIELGDLLTAVREIEPRVVIPMHFKTPKVNLDLLPLEAFLEVFAEFPVERPGSSTVAVARDALPERTTVVVLEHAR